MVVRSQLPDSSYVSALKTTGTDLIKGDMEQICHNGELISTGSMSHVWGNGESERCEFPSPQHKQMHLRKKRCFNHSLSMVDNVLVLARCDAKGLTTRCFKLSFMEAKHVRFPGTPWVFF